MPAGAREPLRRQDCADDADARSPDLLAALATADTPRPTDSSYACAAYADLPQTVFAVLPDGSVRRLRIPEDGACSHYLMSVLRVLQQYR